MDPEPKRSKKKVVWRCSFLVDDGAQRIVLGEFRTGR